MIRVKITSEDKLRAEEITKFRLSNVSRDKLKDKFYSNVIEADKYKFESGLKGALVEVIFAQTFNIPLKLTDGNDEGFDFIIDNKKIDVKHRSFPFNDLMDLILFPNDLKKESNYFFLINIIDDWAYFCGGISKEDFMKKKFTKNYGYGDRFAVNYKDLTLKDLVV